MKKSGHENEYKESNNRPADAAGSIENQITVQAQQPGTYHISLVDQSGRVVYETTAQAKGADIVLDVTEANLDPGLYLVKLTSDQTSKMVKIFNK